MASSAHILHTTWSRITNPAIDALTGFAVWKDTDSTIEFFVPAPVTGEAPVKQYFSLERGLSPEVLLVALKAHYTDAADTTMAGLIQDAIDELVARDA